MSTKATYAIAETDELEAFGRDDVAFDTSAGLDPEDVVEPAEYAGAPASSSRRRVCLFLVIVAVALAAVAAFLGIFLSRKGGDNSSVMDSAGGAQETSVEDGNDDNSIAPATVPPGTGLPPVPGSGAVKTYAVKVLDKHPHDGMAFTQGFEYAHGVFYESTGLVGASSLRKVEIASGKVLQRYDFPDMSLFGEGITLYGKDHIFMLTWKGGRGFVFNQTTFEVIKEWKYEGEGWGLCTDPGKDEVYMSDGTAELRVLDPENLTEKRRVKVTLDGDGVKNLNEIEWVCGEVWANVWLTEKVYRIDPKSGVVKSIIDARILPLRADRRPENDVLNGIAFDKEKGRLWFTGKKWPVVYQVAITDDSLDLTKCK